AVATCFAGLWQGHCIIGGGASLGGGEMEHLKMEHRNEQSGKMGHHESERRNEIEKRGWRGATRNTGAAIAVLLVTFAFGVGSAWAQDASPDQQPGAARASLIQGSVSMQRGDAGDAGPSGTSAGTWDAVTPNTPLFGGDVISAGPGSRAEIQLDYANIVRLS